LGSPRRAISCCSTRTALDPKSLVVVVVGREYIILGLVKMRTLLDVLEQLFAKEF
jgi:hypothetical protein